MFPLVRGALNRLSVRSSHHTARIARHKKKESDFHDKYGLFLFLGGSIFCMVAWTYALIEAKLEPYMSPVGRVRPKDWRRH